MCKYVAFRNYCNYSKAGEVELHIPVVIFMSSREDSLMFASSSVFPREKASLYHRAMSETLSLFLGTDVSDN